jgi:hypothetical protein
MDHHSRALFSACGAGCSTAFSSRWPVTARMDRHRPAETWEAQLGRLASAARAPAATFAASAMWAAESSERRPVAQRALQQAGPVQFLTRPMAPRATQPKAKRWPALMDQTWDGALLSEPAVLAACIWAWWNRYLRARPARRAQWAPEEQLEHFPQ